MNLLHFSLHLYSEDKCKWKGQTLLSVLYHKSVFRAPLMNLWQLKNKVFKNSTAFKKSVRIKKKMFSYIVFGSFPNLLCFFNFKTDRDTRTSFQIFLTSWFFLLTLKKKKNCTEAFLKGTTVQLFHKVKSFSISQRYLNFRSGFKIIKFQLLDGFLESS